jgi:hypothetical protein
MAETTKSPAPRRRTPKQKASAPIKLKLLFCIVDAKKEDFYTDVLQSFEVNFQMSFAARGTANSQILSYFGLSESEKAVLMAVIRDDQEKAALEVLEEKFKTIKNGKGVAFTVSLTSTIGVAMYRFLCNDRTFTEKRDS